MTPQENTSACGLHRVHMQNKRMTALLELVIAGSFAATPTIKNNFLFAYHRF